MKTTSMLLGAVIVFLSSMAHAQVGVPIGQVPARSGFAGPQANFQPPEAFLNLDAARLNRLGVQLNQPFTFPLGPYEFFQVPGSNLNFPSPWQQLFNQPWEQFFPNATFPQRAEFVDSLANASRSFGYNAAGVGDLVRSAGFNSVGFADYNRSFGYNALANAEALATVIRARADFNRSIGYNLMAQGRYNLDTSMARINNSVAQRNEIDNWRFHAYSFFELRNMNRAARRALEGPRPSMEDMIRYARMDVPTRLSPSHLDAPTGQLNWPLVLQAEQFGHYRGQIQEVFARHAASGAIGAADYFRTLQAISLLEGALKQHIRQLPPADYMAARTFLESLQYEAQLAAI